MARQKKIKPEAKPEVAIVTSVSVCKSCGSTEHSEYTSRNEQILNGITYVWQHCKCNACGQWRIDKTIEGK
jgi:hypothetical protein